MRALLITGCLVGPACSPSATSVCKGDDAGTNGVVSGEITVGKQLVAGSELVLPYKVVVLLHSNVLIDRVTVGGTPARLTDATLQQWEALLAQSDLEANRAPGASEAALAVSAIDLCGTPHPIETANVALGPSANIAVSDLTILERHDPADDCSIPTGGSIRPLLRFTASAASVGSKITVGTSLGLLAEGTTTADLMLTNAGDHAEAMTFLVPGEVAGTAVITARGKGDTATPAVLHIVAGPVISAPVTSLQRGVAYNATISSLGNLDRCVIEESNTGFATVTVIEPDVGVITDVKSIREKLLACDTIELDRVSVRFSPATPDGAAVTLRCFDTYGRDQAKTFTVAPAQPP